MDIIELREYIVSLPNVDEVQPFGPDSVVYKVAGRIFACIILFRSEYIAVKCEPTRAAMLRDRYPAITPAWHWNKRHWNDLKIEHLPSSVLKREIRHSYLRVIAQNVSPKSLREKMMTMATEAGLQDEDIE